MARSYAQLAAIVFLIVGFGGFLTGNATQVATGQATGNFDGVALHLTYSRDVIDLLLAGALVYAGFFANEQLSARIVLGVGAFLLVLTVLGFAISDPANGANSFASLHFTVAMNIFDLIAGVLAVLCGFGATGEQPQPAGSRS